VAREPAPAFSFEGHRAVVVQRRLEAVDCIELSHDAFDGVGGRQRDRYSGATDFEIDVAGRCRNCNVCATCDGDVGRR
jgi:hypothetical protein